RVTESCVVSRRLVFRLALCSDPARGNESALSRHLVRLRLRWGHGQGESKGMTERPRPRHFSMIREFRPADFFTLLNGFAGTGVIMSFMRYCVSGEMRTFWIGAGLLPFALVMDVLDGRVARLRKESSPLGQELDSLADVVSFGVAPAAMAFAAGM